MEINIVNETAEPCFSDWLNKFQSEISLVLLGEFHPIDSHENSFQRDTRVLKKIITRKRGETMKTQKIEEERTAPLKIYEKVSDGEDIFYDEITEDPKGLPNAYYAVVGEAHTPLPFFFPYEEYTGLGGTLYNHTFSHVKKADHLPSWAHEYVWSWLDLN